MERLKAELRMLAQHDLGSENNKQAVMDGFLEVLELFLTPEAIDTLSGWEARSLLVLFLADATHLGYDGAVSEFMKHIGPLPSPRQLPAIQVIADNVVSIFDRA